MNRASVMDRLPPQNLESEQSTLGSALLSPVAAEKMLDKLEPSDFYRESHQRICACMAHLRRTRNPVDIITVSNSLRSKTVKDANGIEITMLEAVGGTSYLITLGDSVPTPANVEYYAGIVEEKSILRKLIEASHDVARMAYEPDDDVAVTLGRAEKLFRDIRDRFGDRLDSDVDFQGLIDDLTNEQFERTSPLPIPGIPSGFSGVDYRTEGFCAEELTILGGRPGMGKSACMLSSLSSVCMTDPVQLFNCEGGKRSLGVRMQMINSKYDTSLTARLLKTAVLSEGQKEEILDIRGRIGRMNLKLNVRSKFTLDEIRAITRRRMEKDGVRLLCIDHAGHIAVRGDQATERAIRVAEGVLDLATDLKIPVLLLWQLRRFTGKPSDDKRPTMEDLINSSRVEQVATNIIFVHREGYYKKKDDRPSVVLPQDAELIVEKSRNGNPGVVPVKAVLNKTLFYEPEFSYR